MTTVEQPSASYRPSAPLGAFVSSSAGHLPFAADLLASFKPSTLVTLGVANGDVYFGLCQLVSDYGYRCLAYGIDNWPDAKTRNSKAPSSSSFDLVSRHNSSHFGAFSKLIGNSFEDASISFKNESVDLLVVDSLLPYEALRATFDCWLPKVHPDGIVLLNNISVRNTPTGASRVWKDLTTAFPSFSFLNNHGLGVFAKSAEQEFKDGFLAGFFRTSAEQQERLRRYYSLCAERFEQGAKAESASLPLAMNSEFQVFHSHDSIYDAVPGLSHQIPSNAWVNLHLDLPAGTGDRPLRLHVSSLPAVVDIATLSLRKEDGHTVWSWNPKEPTEQLRVAGTSIRLPEPEFFRVLAVGDSPYVFLPEFAGPTFQQSLELEIRLRVDLELGAVKEIAAKASEPVAANVATADSVISRTKADSAKYLAQSRIEYESKIRQLTADADARIEALRSEVEALRTQLETSSAEHQHLTSQQLAYLDEERRSHQVTMLERENLSTQQSRMLQEISIAQGNVEELKAEVERLTGELANGAFDLTETRKLNARLASSLEEERNVRVHMQESGSWQLTKPLRAVGDLFGPRKRY